MKTKKITVLLLLVVFVITISIASLFIFNKQVKAETNTVSTIETFDNAYNVLASGITGREVKEYNGMPYLSAKSSATAESLIRKDIAPAIDVSSITQDLVLKLDFYIEDASVIDNSWNKRGQIELSSSGVSDRNEYSWFTSNLVIKDGWNSLSLPFSTATNEGGPMDLSNINYFRFYIFTKSSVELGFANARIEVVEQANSVCDFTESDWQVSGATLKNRELTLTADTATLSYKSSNLKIADLYTCFAEFACTTQISNIKLLLGNSNANLWATYCLTTADLENGACVNLEAYDSIDDGFISVNTDIIKIEFNGKSGDTATLKHVKIMAAREFLNAKIKELGKFEDLTVANYTDYQPKIEFLQELIDDYMTRIGKQTKATYNYFDCEMYLYASDYFENYLAFLCFADAVNEFEENKASGFIIDTQISTTETTANQMVTFSFNVTNLTSSSKNYNYEVKYNKMILEDFAEAAKGSVEISANSTETVVVPFNTIMGGTSLVTVDLKNGNTLLESAFERVFVSGKGVYLADCHDHSTRSDGTDTLAVNFMHYLSYGASFVITADHNAWIGNNDDIEYALSVLEAAGMDFFAFKGSEVTPTYNGHTLQYGYSGYVPYTTETNSPEANKIELEQIMSNGGHAYIAHPLFPGSDNYAGLTSSSVTDLYTNFTGIEIINAARIRDSASCLNYNLAAIAWWDKMNITGNRKYFGIGDSDAHAYEQIWNGFNGFVLDELNWKNIDNALANGNFFASTGPQLIYTLGGKQMGQTLIASGKTVVPLNVSAYCGETYLKGFPNAYIKSVDLIGYQISTDVEGAYSSRKVINLYTDNGERATYFSTNQDIEVENGWFYRLEVKTDVNIVFAISNPIWVSETGAFSVTESVNANAGESLWITATQTEVFDTVYFSTDDEGITVKPTGYVTVDDGVYTGKYVIKAISASGQEKEITLNVKGETPPKEGKKGCGSFVGSTSIIAFTVLTIGAVVALNKKKGF